MQRSDVRRKRSPPAEGESHERWWEVKGDGPATLKVLAAASVGLLGLAVLYTLYFARAFLVPVAVALFLNFLLTPLVRLVGRRLRLPSGAAGIVVFVGLIGVLGAGFYRLTDPALTWLESAPARVHEAEAKIRSLIRPVAEMRDAVDDAASGEEAEEGGTGDEDAVRLEGESLTARLLSRAGEMLVGLAAALFLLLFLLTTGDLLLRKVLSTISRWGDRRRLVEIVRRIERDLSHYLLTKSLINTGLGLAVGTAMWLWGMPNPVLWGVLAGLLNFIPYVGGVVGVVFLGVVGLVSFEDVGRGLLPALTYLALNVTEAYIVTPTIMGRRFSLNPVAVFLSVLFWGWIWGVAGALMAVPILTAVAIVAGRIDRLAPFGRVLEGRG